MTFAKTISSIEFNVINAVKPFLDQMAKEGASKKSSTPEYGNKILAEAIAKGISTALVDPALQAAFSIIVDSNLNVIVPVGALAFNQIVTSVKTNAIPNPNLKP